jgi:hypothetical protein
VAVIESGTCGSVGKYPFEGSRTPDRYAGFCLAIREQNHMEVELLPVIFWEWRV